MEIPAGLWCDLRFGSSRLAAAVADLTGAKADKIFAAKFASPRARANCHFKLP
jgi:hypothetical protein